MPNPSVCDDLDNDQQCDLFWERANAEYPALKEKLFHIRSAFILAGNLVMDDYYKMDELEMHSILGGVQIPIKFSAMLIRLIGGRYKGQKIIQRKLTSMTLGLTQSKESQGGYMEPRFETSPRAPLPAPALSSHPVS